MKSLEKVLTDICELCYKYMNGGSIIIDPNINEGSVKVCDICYTKVQQYCNNTDKRLQ